MKLSTKVGLLVGLLLLAMSPSAVAQDSEKLTLDGEFDYATAPDSPTLSVTGEAFTLEVWIKHDGTSDADAMILDKRDAGGGGIRL